MVVHAPPIEEQLRDVARRLQAEFDGVFEPTRVEDEVERAYRRSDSARIRLMSAVFAYRFAREALRRAAAPARDGEPRAVTEPREASAPPGRGFLGSPDVGPTAGAFGTDVGRRRVGSTSAAVVGEVR